MARRIAITLVSLVLGVMSFMLVGSRLGRAWRMRVVLGLTPWDERSR